MSDQKLLPVAPADTAETAEVSQVEVVEFDGGSIQIRAHSHYISRHHSISAELMTAQISQSTAAKEVAHSRYAIPARESTKQILIIACALVLVVGIGVFGAMRVPAVASYVAAMVAVMGTVFGGMFYVSKKRPPEPPSP